MRLSKLLGALALACTGVSATGVAMAEAPPLSAYGNLPDLEDAVLSPSGDRHAIISTIEGVRHLLMVEDGQVLRALNLSDFKIRWMRWIDDERLLIVSSRTADLGYGFTTDKAEIQGAYVVSTDPDGQMEVIFANQDNLANGIFGSYGIRQTDKGLTAFFGAIEYEKSNTGSKLRKYVFNHGRPALYAVDLSNLKPRRIASSAPEGNHKDWLVGADGTVAATLQFEAHGGAWTIRNSDDSTIAEGVNPTGGVSLMSLGADGSSAIFTRETPETGENNWYEVPLSGASSPAPFLADVGVNSLYTHGLTGRYIGYRSENGERVMLDPRYSKRLAAVAGAFPDLNLGLQDWTDDFGALLVRTDGNQDSGTWYYVNLAKRKADAIGYERIAIGPSKVGPISTVEYKAADGLELDGILTLPPGREAKDLPAIMLPHGGPHASDSEGFDWWAQAFASRGYAVFQPNFRGSTNRDDAFVRAGYGEWGRKMQTDVSDGLAALADKGIIDPDRVCIVGASYGGYAALAGVTLQQGIYRCAVAVAPVTDLKLKTRLKMRAVNGSSGGLTERILEEMMGPRSGYDAVSPYRHADAADAPILLIHGRDDTVVEYVHSKKMADALKDAGKPFEMIDLEEEDHYLSRGATRLQMLEASVGFVEKHNPAG